MIYHKFLLILFSGALFWFLWFSALAAPTNKQCGALGNPNPCGAENVCSRPDVLFCESWDDGDRTGWDWNPSWNDTCPNDRGCILPATMGMNLNAFRIHLYENDAESPYPWNYPSFAPQPSTQETYMRWYTKFSPGYKFMAGYSDGEKHLYYRGDSGGNLKWCVMIGVQAPDGNPNIARFNMSQCLDHSPVWTPNVVQDSYIVTPNRTYCIETMVQANTPGASNGRVRMWIDGEPYISYDAIKPDKNDTGVPLTTAPWITAHYGGNPGPPHPAQDIWYDDIVVAKSRIGCGSISGSDTTPPAAPQGVSVL